EQKTARQKQVCTPEFFRERADYGATGREPIFILGRPRAGSTLLEQMLASHSEVEGTQELANVPRVVLDLQGYDPDLDNPRYPACLAAMTADAFRVLGVKYLADTRIYRGGKPRFIDKMPNNFRHVGLILLMLPNAKIIDARREPMACCFGNLKQLYARGQEFAYSVEDIARYYRTYLELMEHWDAVLPGRVLRVHYEDVGEDREGSVRLLLERGELTCGSTWHAAGGMHTLNGDPNVARLQQYTINLYKDLERISGQSCGLHMPGGIMLAGTRERFDWLKMAQARGRYLGMDLELISADEAARVFPIIDKRHFVGALLDPIEGHVDPYGVT